MRFWKKNIPIHYNILKKKEKEKKKQKCTYLCNIVFSRLFEFCLHKNSRDINVLL